MSDSVAFPFEIRRGDDSLGLEVISRRETIHGLLRLDGGRLVIQWRMSRTTQRVGWTIQTDHEMEPVQEMVMPLSVLRSASVEWEWLRWPPGRYLIITAADLKAFEGIAGPGGLQLKHPAELALRLPRSALVAAKLFASELDLALADRALASAFEPDRLAPGSEGS